jgi:hypothetical protein
VTTVLHAAGWRVEETWLDLDGRGPRTWFRAVDRWGAEHWCTTARLQELLRADGLDFGDLTVVAPARLADADDGCE